MGVSGSGKSTVGAALAQRLRVPFEDADDFHPPANIAKMTAGQALDDEDRLALAGGDRGVARGHGDGGGVMSCSALKRKYRDQLRHHAPGVEFVHLDGSREVIARRQASRPGHFMPASLLASQFATLEPLAAGRAGCRRSTSTRASTRSSRSPSPGLDALDPTEENSDVHLSAVLPLAGDRPRSNRSPPDGS